MPTARTLANIKKHHYRILTRNAAAFAIPADLSEMTTLLATFTELGIARDKTTKFPIVEGDKESMDYPAGSSKTLGYTLNGEAVLLQSDVSDDTAIALIDGVEQDLLLYSQSTGKCRFYPTVVTNFEEQANAGETETTTLKVTRENVGTKAELRTIFDAPTS